MRKMPKDIIPIQAHLPCCHHWLLTFILSHPFPCTNETNIQITPACVVEASMTNNSRKIINAECPYMALDDVQDKSKDTNPHESWVELLLPRKEGNASPYAY